MSITARPAPRKDAQRQRFEFLISKAKLKQVECALTVDSFDDEQLCIEGASIGHTSTWSSQLPPRAITHCLHVRQATISPCTWYWVGLVW